MKKSAIILGLFFILAADGLGFSVGTARAADQPLVGTALAVAAVTSTPTSSISIVATADASTIAPDVDDCATLTPADLAALQAAEAQGDLNQELVLRKQLLSQTITCATQDAQALQVTLTAISLPPGVTDAAVIQSQLSGEIDNAITFYNLESAKLNGAGVSATEAIASQMLDWRAANYLPLEGDVNNFALWAENQVLFQTAQNRLTQTTQVVAFIENAATTDGSLDATLQAAQSSFTAAQAENTAAATALAQLQSPDETLGLIQQSLQSLAATYQKFTALNALIQPLLSG